MNTLLLLPVLALLVSGRAIQAQTPSSTRPPTPAKTADRRAATYKGPKVVQDSKALGRKMVQKSKPVDSRILAPRVQ